MAWMSRWAWANSWSIPSPVRAEMGITGTPSSRESRSTSIRSPCFSTSSIMFRAMIMGRSSSMSCTVKYRFRSRLVPSTMLMMASGFSSTMNRRATSSSMEWGESE